MGVVVLCVVFDCVCVLDVVMWLLRDACMCLCHVVPDWSRWCWCVRGCVFELCDGVWVADVIDLL